MSFPTIEGGAQPPQQGGQEQYGQEQGGFGAQPGAPQQPTPMGQQMDPSQQQGQFPPQGGPQGTPGPNQGGDQKTTLW